jgi:hypothetical protein
MSSFESFAAFSQWCEVPSAEGMFPTAFGTSSASAPKSRAAPPIPNANTEAVPTINFLIIVILVFRKLVNRRTTIQNNLAANRVPCGQLCQTWDKRHGV